MPTVIAGRPITLQSQWYAFNGGPLNDLDANPSITITSIATGTVALAPTTAGVTHPGTGSYGYIWTPVATLTPGDYLVQWSGLKAGAPVTATETVTVEAPLAARVYATTAQLADYLGTAAPADAAKLLRDASRALDSALRTAVYDTDGAGMPTHPEVQAAFTEAVCAIVEWWEQTGDPVGAEGGWESVSAGPVSLSGRSSSTATPIAAGVLPPRALAVLQLVPGCHLSFGVWSTW
jgi:hypothetical protein